MSQTDSYIAKRGGPPPRPIHAQRMINEASKASDAIAVHML